MKKTAIVLFLSLFIFNSVGQNLKTYTGKFEKGNATYTYYENKEMERIYHGKFEFAQTDIIGALLKYSGEYKDGKKNGKWIETYSNCKNPYNKEFNYKNGNYDGVCTESFYNTAGLNAKANGLLRTTKITYRDGLPIRFSIIKPSTQELVGRINSNGRADSTWSIKGVIYRKEEGQYSPQPVDVTGRRVYKDGILVESKIVETSTGKFIEKYNIDTTTSPSKYLKYFFNEYEKGTKFSVNNGETPIDIDELLDLETSFNWKEKYPILIGSPELVTLTNNFMAKFKQHRGMYDTLVNYNSFSELSLNEADYQTKVKRARGVNKELHNKMKTSFDNLYQEFLYVRILRYLCTTESLESIDERLNYLLNISNGSNMLGGTIANMGGSNNETVPGKFYLDKDYMAKKTQNYDLLYKNGLLTLRNEALIEEMKTSFANKNISDDKLLTEIRTLLKAELVK